MRKKHGCPIGSKNKLKTMNIDIAIMTSTVITTIFLLTKEQADYEMSLHLRKEGKITTAGTLFELSDKKEVDALIGQGVFIFEMFNPTKHSNTRIFESHMIYKVKGKATNIPYEKSCLVIQGYSNSGKGLILTQSLTIQCIS